MVAQNIFKNTMTFIIDKRQISKSRHGSLELELKGNRRFYMNSIYI